MEGLRLADIAVRTFGWIQNPGDFGKLKRTVQIFDHTSSVHIDLKENRIPRLICSADGRDSFIAVLNLIPLKLKYSDLIGTSFTPRSSARCNGIIQAALEGQKRDFTDNWTSDGFLRWAHALGFVDYDHEN
ncbi:MAG TPA: restriction endonuclease FokI recognition domain-containing protein, partial [Ruminiclostridium sp.]|nr:restriction endonuclease FokI recognition domain-containing protein [Ruminiclostridium sp.]